MEDFWLDTQNATAFMKKINEQKDMIKNYTVLEDQLNDIEALWELAVEADDEEVAGEAKAACRPFAKKLDALDLQLLLSGDYDDHNALLSLHAGAGGVEAQDWVEMLLRMYTRYCDKRGFKTETIDFLPGDEAGVKSVTLAVEGLNSYGYLKSERGVHRLVRISPFDAAGRRHTSFASVEVLPQVE
ncbi:MAG: PCRF domain-containing protein, partial [Clostridiales bacterium]